MGILRGQGVPFVITPRTTLRRYRPRPPATSALGALQRLDKRAGSRDDEDGSEIP